MIRKKDPKRKVYISFLRSYLLAIVVPLVVGGIVSVVALNTLEKNAETYAFNGISNVMSNVETKLEELDRVSQYLSQSALTHKMSFSSPGQGAVFYSQMVDYVKYLSDFWVTNEDVLLRLYVYLDNSEYFVSPETSYQLEDFYPYFFKYEALEQADFLSWMEQSAPTLQIVPDAQVYLRDSARQAGEISTTLLIRPISINYDGKRYGSILMLMDSKWLSQQLERLQMGQNGGGAILDPEGKVIASYGDIELLFQLQEGQPSLLSGEDSVISMNDSMILRTVSAATGWTYVAIGSEQDVLSDVWYIRTIFGILLLVALLFGTVVACMMAWGSSNPLTRMILKTGLSTEEFSSGEKIYGVLEHQIDHILSDKKLLEEKVGQISAQMPSLFLNRLYSGNFSGEERIETIGHEMGVLVPQGRHVAVLIRLATEADVSERDEVIRIGLQKEQVISLLQAAEGADAVIYHASLSDLVWLYSSQDEDIDSALEPVLLEFSDKLREKGICCLIAVGSPFENLQIAYKSYNNALGSASRQVPSHKIPVLWYWNLYESDQRHSYSSKQEERLLQNARQGEYAEVNRLLNEVRKENFLDKDLPGLEKESLAGAMERTASQLSPEGIRFSRQPDRQDPAERFAWAAKWIKESCITFQEQQQTSAKKLSDKIKQYIDENYSNPEIGLKLVASEISISEAYLSRIFKEQLGENFASYVERLRIQRAKELLADPSISIGDISEKAGYNSDHAFRRAFKRVTGLSPQEYRSQL